MPNVSKDTPLAEITLRRYEKPYNLSKRELVKKEPQFPLEVMLCRTCSLVQLRDVVSPKLLFGNYVYVSSTSPSRSWPPSSWENR